MTAGGCLGALEIGGGGEVDVSDADAAECFAGDTQVPPEPVQLVSGDPVEPLAGFTANRVESAETGQRCGKKSLCAQVSRMFW